MIFELSTALHYLYPRFRYFSVSIISLISIFVIALVVWLSIVFFSAQESIELRWTEKMVAITSPMRLTPTSHYYNSYYYKIDLLSQDSNFSPKSISEKLKSNQTDPYNPDIDPPIPSQFPKPLKDSKGNVIDVVKKTQELIENLGYHCSSFETTYANLKLLFSQQEDENQYISQSSYLLSFDPGNARLQKSILPILSSDVQNVLEKILKSEQTKDLLDFFFQDTTITKLKAPLFHWHFPKTLFKNDTSLSCRAIVIKDRIQSIEVFSKAEFPKEIEHDDNFTILLGRVKKENSGFSFYDQSNKKWNVPDQAPFVLANDVFFTASDPKYENELSFQCKGVIQNISISERFSFSELEVAGFHLNPTSTPHFWIERDPKNSDLLLLPNSPKFGHGIIVPKYFRDSGIAVLDTGYLTYSAPTVTTLQEMKVPVFVAGFYDPGIIPVGGKLILIDTDIVSLIQSTQYKDEQTFPTGLQVNFSNLKNAKQVEEKISKILQENGIAKFWNIQTYDNFDFTKDVFQQMKSDRNLFSLISCIIMVVACSNIISMLIILVHDKKQEIAILRALGASKKSIALIFGLSGFIMGTIGSVIGALASWYTLKHLQSLLQFIGKIQGQQVLTTAFYGEIVTAEFSQYSFFFVIIITAIGSCIAGVVPAIQSSRLNTSEALRGE